MVCVRAARGQSVEGVFLLLPGWDAIPLQGYTQHEIQQYPFIHLGRERHCEGQSVLHKNRIQCPWAGLEPGPLDPEFSALQP